MDEFKEIKDFPNYFIYNDGRIYSKWLKGFLIPWLDTKGRYYIIGLCKNGKRYNKLLHRLVAQHFIDNPNNLPEVNHIDYNSQNNLYTNLEWITRKGNMEHCFQKHSPINNYRKCSLYYGDKLVGNFKSVIEACRFGRDNLGLSCSTLNKYRKIGEYKIITER